MPVYLLLPQPGLTAERLAASLRAHGLAPVADGLATQPYRFSDGALPQPSSVDYWEDRTLTLRRLYTRGPRAAELRQLCAEHWPCWTPAEALARAEQAATPADKVTTLAPLGAVLAYEPTHGPQVQAIVRARLSDEVRAVYQAARLVLEGLPTELQLSLLQALSVEPQLAAARRHELAAYAAAATPAQEQADVDEPTALQQRAELAIGKGEYELARRLLGRALELEPLASAAYQLRAQASAADGRPWPAMIDVTTALAIARRQGVPLQPMQELQHGLRVALQAAATPPTAAVELLAVAQLVLLLRHGRLHEVEEIAETLLPLPGRAPLWWLAIGLSRWERGRPERAAEALEAALAGEPGLAAARFLRGQCHQARGDIEAALSDYALLDPVAGARPAQPSLLTAYADELLGTQAPWDAREHAFERVQLLRQRERLVEALAVITTLLRREPTAADALLAQGILFAELAQPAAALIVLDQALAALRPQERLLSSEDPLATLQLHRAAVLSTLGDQEGAAAARHTAQRLGAEPAEPPAAELTPSPTAPPPPAAAAAYAELRRLAQQTLVHDSLIAAFTDPAPSARGHVDTAVARTALRAQVAELLVAALAALDTEADAAACRALVQRARRALTALSQLAPQVVTTQTINTLLDTTARALGIATPDPL